MLALRTLIIKWFSGPRFWYLLGTVELALLVTELLVLHMSELRAVQHSIILWIAFATAEILSTTNVCKSDNA